MLLQSLVGSDHWISFIGFHLLIFANSQIFFSAESIPGTAGVDYPIFAQPPETSFVCEGYIQGALYNPLPELSTHSTIPPLVKATTPTLRRSARPSTSAGTMVEADLPSTASSAPMEPSSTNNTSSATGGSTSTVHRWATVANHLG